MRGLLSEWDDLGVFETALYIYNGDFKDDANAIA